MTLSSSPPTRPEGPAADALPPGSPLTRCLSELALAWTTVTQVGVTAEAGGSATSPEALQTLARGLNLATSYRSARLAEIADTELPVIVLLASGLGHVVTGRTGDTVSILKDQTVHVVAAAALAAQEAGTIFTCRPQRALAPEDGADRAAPEAVRLLGGVARHMLVENRATVLNMMIAAMLGNLLLMAMPLFSMSVYDRVIPHNATETLWALSIGVALALCLDLALRFVRIKLADALSVSAGIWLQTRLFGHLTEIEISRAPRSGGTFASQLREADGIAQIVPQVLAGVCVDLPFLLIVVAILALVSGPVAAVPLAGLVVLMAAAVAVEKLAEHPTRQSAALARRQMALVVETVEEVETLRSATAEAQSVERFERLSDEAAGTGHAGRLWMAFGAYANLFLGQVIVVAVMIVAVYRIGEGAMTVGAMSAASLLVGRMIGPASQLVGLWGRARILARSLTGLETFLAEPTERGAAGSVLAPPARGTIAMKAVTFAYPGTAANRLTDISFSIAPGERVGLIGRTGCGKSTLLRLMTRMHQPDRGTVSYADHNIAQYDPRRLRGLIGHMRQEPSLLDDTLLANITLGSGPFDQERFERACRIAGVSDFAGRHAEGYGLRVGPRGERLSGGERQSVTLARLIYRTPPILLLDEPTAAMDTIMEARVVRDLKTHLTDQTLILATHRAPLLALVDRLIWIDDGRILADGPRAEVLQRLERPAS